MPRRDYTGRIELLDKEDEVIDEVQVALRYTVEPNGLGEWGGKVHPANLGPGDWMMTRKIRMPTDETGDAFVENYNVTDKGTQQRWIRGSGPPPF